MRVSKRVQQAQREREALRAKMSTLKFSVSEEEFNRFENPDSEEDTVRFIRQYLLTEEQRKALYEANVTLEDCLNGRTTGEHDALVDGLFDAWNEKLGYKGFGF